MKQILQSAQIIFVRIVLRMTSSNQANHVIMCE